MRLSKDEFVNELNRSILLLQQSTAYVKLGPEYAQMSYQDARHNLTYHRMFKKFEEPDDQRQQNVKDSSVHSMFSYDENQGYCVSRFTRLPQVVRKDIYRLRETIVNQLRSAIYKNKLQITTGENVISRNGDTSVYSKLANMEAWTCSVKNKDLAFQFVKENRLLRRMLCKHYKDLLWKDYVKRRNLLSVSSILSLPADHWKTFKRRHFSFIHKKYGSVLRHMFFKVVTFTSYARVTTVPKDNEVARVIITCPLFDMISQRSDAHFLKKVMHSNYGIQLDFTQNIQRNRIFDYSNVTVDFKNASNSTLYDTVEFLFGDTSFFKKHLNVSRISDVHYKDQWHSLSMFSPMGCGSTFELMTYILTAAARLFDADATVFGDDVVIKAEHYERFAALCDALGYKVNVTKTFLDGYFRESCGSFISHGLTLKCYDFEWAQDYYSAVILMNKLRLIRHGIYALEVLYQRLITLVPLLTFKMAPDDHPVLDDGIPSCDNLIRKQRKCAQSVKIYKSLLSGNAYARRSTSITQYYVREMLSQKCENLWNDIKDEDVDLAVYSSYMYAMRVTTPQLRNTERTTSQMVLCEINNNLPVTFSD